MRFSKTIRSAIAMTMLSIATTTALPGCHPDTATSTATTTPSLPTVSVQIGQQTFTLEVADDNSERQTGLMHRRSMAADHGMIFVFPSESMREFWMKNTHIPLDILYLDKAGKIVSIRKLEPLNERSVSSIFPAQYAIELNQGAAAKAGVRVGEMIAIPAEARATED